MNTTIKILAIIALLAACCTAPAALGDTITWDLDSTNGDGISWSDELNWTPEDKPGAGDTAVLPWREGILYTVRISGSDEECEIIQVSSSATLEIKGQVLTLGDTSGNTTTISTVDGIVKFVKDASNNKAELKVRSWVSFEGAGTISAAYDDNQPVWGTISRASNGTGINVLETVKVKGHMQLLVSIVHDSYAGADSVTFTNDVDIDDEVMIFGSSAGAFTPDLNISTTTSANARAWFEAVDGKMEFHAVKFGSTAPNWRILVDGEIEVASEPSSAYFVEVPFDVLIVKRGLLDFKHHFSCTGTLTVDTVGGTDPVIHVDLGKIAEFRP